MAKKTTRRTSYSRKSQPSRSVFSKMIRFIVFSFLLLILLAAVYHYRDGLAYYLGFKSSKVLDED
ncbi:MAG: glycoside hydrolase family 25 protein, partial [Flavobacterium sp.]